MDTIARGLALKPSAKYASGKYYMPEGYYYLANGAAAPAGTLRMMPGYIHDAVTLASLVAKITTVAAGGLFQFALYCSDPFTNAPTGAPLFVSASQSTAVAQNMEIAASVVLPRGLYWGAVQVDATGAATAFYSFTGAPAPLTMPQFVGFTTLADMFSAAPRAGYTKAGVFGTWPTLTGNVAADALALDASSVIPAWAFKVA
jgi:hypothetical protein